MERTLGVDHGTQGLRFCLLDGHNQRFFEIKREQAAKASILKGLGEKGFLDVDLVGLTYSMADAITAITDVKKLRNRGQVTRVTGEFLGGGTRLFDEIQSCGIRAVLIPGLHRGISCLDERFKLLYSHMAASEKVALAYHAFNLINKEMRAEELVIADISSNTVTIGIKKARFFGAIDACLGAPGLLHGPLDMGLIRDVDEGKTTANKAFYRGGMAQKSRRSPEDILKGRDEKARLALDSLLLAVEMEVLGFASVLAPQAIAVSGSAGIHENMFPKLKEAFKGVAPVFKLNAFAAAIGAAEIARDMLKGKGDFLGIGVDV